MPTTTNFGWTTPADTDLVKDGAAAIRTLGNGIDTSFLDLKGGTTGQILSKATNTDLDFSWTTPSSGIPETIIDAKGDLIAGTAADTAGRLAVGTNGQYLVADSTASTGLKWQTLPASGKVLQVVAATTTTATSNSTNVYADTTLTASITPSATSSKILVLVNQNGCRKAAGNANTAIELQLLRGATALGEFSGYGLYTGVSEALDGFSFGFSYLDSPNTTSSTTYKTQLKNNVNAAAVAVQWNSDVSSIVLIEIGA